MARCAQVGLAHHDGDLAAGIADARRPPFAAVDDIVIAIALDAGFDVGGVGGRDRGFRHQEGGADFAIHQRPQPLPLVLPGAVAHQHLHVAGIRCGAIEHFRSPADVAHFLGQRRIFEIGQPRTAEFVVLMRGRRHEHVPEPFGPRLLLQLLDDRDHLPARPRFVLLAVDGDGGPDMLGHERLHTAEPFFLTIRHVEVHWAFLTFGQEFWRHCLPAAGSPQELFVAPPSNRRPPAKRSPERRCVTRIDIPTFKP